MPFVNFFEPGARVFEVDVLVGRLGTGDPRG